MVCPICVADGLIVASCRFFGLPDPVTAYFIGIITLSFAIVTVRWLKSWFKSKLLLENTPKGTLTFILAVYTTITIVAMRTIGMF